MRSGHRGEGMRFREQKRGEPGLKSLIKKAEAVVPALIVALGGVSAISDKGRVEPLPQTPIKAEQLGKAPSQEATPLLRRTIKGSEGGWNIALGDIRLTNTLSVKRETGEIDFNPLAYLFQGQLEVPYNKEVDELMLLNLPMKLAQKFNRDPNSRTPLRKEDEQEIAKYIGERLKMEFTDALRTWSVLPSAVQNMQKGVYRLHHQMDGMMSDETKNKKIKIESLKTTGSASFEGELKGESPEQKVQAVRIGLFDPENKELALTRGTYGQELVRRDLRVRILIPRRLDQKNCR